MTSLARYRAEAATVVLVIGAALYLARPTDPAAVAWADGAGLHGLARATSQLRQTVFALAPAPSWLRGAASDFAYAFALGAVFAGARRTMLALGLAFALAHEVGQGLGLFAGTFDVLDLAVLATGFTAACALFSAPAYATLPRNTGWAPVRPTSKPSASTSRSRPVDFAS